jgi:hypothetical protein
MEAGQQRRKQGENKAMPERFAPSGPEALLEALRARERFAPAEILATALAGLRQPWSVFRHRRLSAFEAGRDGGYGGLYIVLHPGKGIALVDLELAAPFSALLRLRRLLQATQFEPFLRDQPPVVALALNRGDLRNLERRLSDALACAGPCRIAEADWTGLAVAAIASVDFGLMQVQGSASLALPRPNPSPSAFPQLPALATAASRMGQALMRVAEMRERGWNAPFFPLVKGGGARMVRAVRICGLSRLGLTLQDQRRYAAALWRRGTAQALIAVRVATQGLARRDLTLLSQKGYAVVVWRQAAARAFIPARDSLGKLWEERGSTQIAIAHRLRAVFSAGFRAVEAAIRAAWRGASSAAAVARASLDSAHGALGSTALAPSSLGVALRLRLRQALLWSPVARRIEWRGNSFALGIAGAALGAIAAGFLIAAHGPLTPTQAPLVRAQATANAAEPSGQVPAQPPVAQEASSRVTVAPVRTPAPAAMAHGPSPAQDLATPAEPKTTDAPAAIEASSEARRNAAAPKPQPALPVPLLEPAAVPEPALDAQPPKPQAARAIASAPSLESGTIKKSAKPAEIAAVPLPPPFFPSPPERNAPFRAQWTAPPPTRAVSARERWFSPYDGPEYDYANRQSQ